MLEIKLIGNNAHLICFCHGRYAELCMEILCLLCRCELMPETVKTLLMVLCVLKDGKYW